MNSKENYHTFWDNAFSGLGVEDNIMMIGSAPTDNITPVGVDFFEIRRHNVPFVGHNHYGPES